MNEFRRLIIDSRYKTKHSLSNSDFSVDLPQPCLVPKGSKIWVDCVTFSHVFGTVMSGVNDKLYLKERLYNTSAASYRIFHRYVVLDPGIYTISSMAVHVQDKLNENRPTGIDEYVVTVLDGFLRFKNLTPLATGDAMIYSRKQMTDVDLNYLGFYAQYPPSANPPTNFREAFAFVPALGGNTVALPTELQDATELIGLIDTPVVIGATAQPMPVGQPELSFGSKAEGQFVDLSRFKNLYICTHDLGEGQTLHVDGSTSIIRRVPISSAHGSVISDSLSTLIEYNTVRSELLLTQLHFMIKGFGGEVIPLAGHEIVFTIVIEPPE